MSNNPPALCVSGSGCDVLAPVAAALVLLALPATVSAAAFSCNTSASTVAVTVTGGTSSDSLVITGSSGTYTIKLDGNTDPTCTGISDSTYSAVQVSEPSSSTPTTFLLAEDFGLTFAGAAGVQNTLDLGSAISGLATVGIGADGSGNVTGGASIDTFTGVNVVTGSTTAGGTAFNANSAGTSIGTISLAGRGTGSNSLSMGGFTASASAPLTIDTGAGSVSQAGSALIDFAGIASFVGSSTGYTTFAATSGNNFSFSGGGQSNTLSFAQIPASGSNVAFTISGGVPYTGSATPSAGGSYTFSDIQNFVASPNGDILNCSTQPAGLSVAFSSKVATVTTSMGSITASGMTEFVGSSAGQNDFTAPANGNYAFVAGGTGNLVDLSALAASASAPLTIDIGGGSPLPDVASNASVVDQFSGIQSFTGSSQGTTHFVSNGGNGLVFTGQGSGNVLDLSTAPTSTQIQIDLSGTGTVTSGSSNETFSNVAQVKGPSSGAASFVAVATGSGTTQLSFVGQGAGNALDLSAFPASAALVVDTVLATVSSGATQLETFADIQSFIGSSEGSSTFQTGGSGGLNFTGQGSGNVLSFAEVADSTGIIVKLPPNPQGQETAFHGTGSDTFTGITTIIGSPNNDTFFGGPGNYTIEGHAGDTLNYIPAPNPIDVSFSGTTATVTGGFSGTTSAVGLTTFVGSSGGGNVFVVPPDGGYSFVGSGGAGNVLNLIAAPGGIEVSGGQNGSVSGLNFGVGGATDSYQDIQTIENVPQTLAFTSTKPSSAMVGGAPYAASATATSGLTVTLSIDATSNGVCAISGGTVSFAAKGPCTIDANQSGNSEYRAATQMQQTFSVYGAVAQLAFTAQPPFSIFQGDTLGTVVVSAEDSTGTVTPASGAVDFIAPGCGGTVDLGTVAMSNGISTLVSSQRFYTPTAAGALSLNAIMGTLSGTSSAFGVTANPDLVFSAGFESCRL